MLLAFERYLAGQLDCPCRRTQLLEKDRHHGGSSPYELGELTHTSLHAIKVPAGRDELSDDVESGGEGAASRFAPK
jgi:hypothetical protein